MNSLFITGANGFIGRNLLKSIDTSRYDQIYCMVRRKNVLPDGMLLQKNVKFVECDIFDCKAYSNFLAVSNTVVHLAAITGKAKREDYFTVNAKGTQFLIEQCKKANIENFLHISTIAVKFQDKSRYYYAQSKVLAEQAVRSSGLKYTIVRPTIVIGRDGETWRSLSMFARTPVIPMIGSGTTKLQPIYIDDLVTSILSILYGNIFTNEVFELGGPEEITFQKFLTEIHYMYYKKNAIVIHVPLKIIKFFLSITEGLFYSVLPITAGQLSPFVNDSTAEANRVFHINVSEMRNIRRILELMIQRKCKPHTHYIYYKECETFTLYLINKKPDSYILDKYRDASKLENISKKTELYLFDNFLVSIARKSTFLTKLVDSYTCLFYNKSAVRRKLILILSILESISSTTLYFEKTDASYKTFILMKIFYKTAYFILLLIVAILLFSPIHFAYFLLKKVFIKKNK